VTNTVDPLGGSYYIEALTDSIESEVESYLRTIEEMGGMVKAIEKGYIQKEIQDAAYRYQQDIESGNRIIVGVNAFRTEEASMPDLHKVDPAIREVQTRKLNEVKESRDSDAVRQALEKLRGAARDEGENLMPHIIEAVRSYATLGEICGILREEFGEYKESITF
jgi:methylmalonyl-CoA mutase N-terminal domain/subunit